MYIYIYDVVYMRVRFGNDPGAKRIQAFIKSLAANPLKGAFQFAKTPNPDRQPEGKRAFLEGIREALSWFCYFL